MVLELNTADFNSEVLQSDVPVVVDFGATWCSPCRQMAPAIEQLATEVDGQAKVCTVDVENNMELAQQYKINAIPVVLFFKNGEEAKRMIGLQRTETLKEQLAQIT